MYARLAPLALLALPHIAAAVELADFLPRVENLPRACQAIYTSTVSGCQGSDFGPSGCSTGCVNGLQEMTAAVKAACGNQNLEGSNVIVAYLADAGPETLCRNAKQILSAESSSSAKAASTSTTSTSTLTASQSTTTASSSVASSSADSSSSTTTVTTTSTDLTVDTSSTTAAASTSASATTTSHTTSPSHYNDGSGGGSPFDQQSNTGGGSAITATFGMGTLTIGMVVLALR